MYWNGATTAEGADVTAEFIMKWADVATKPNKQSKLKSNKSGVAHTNSGIKGATRRVDKPAKPTAKVCNVMSVNPPVPELKDRVRVSISANATLPPRATSAGKDKTASLVEK